MNVPNLTATEWRVADFVSLGMDYKRIAAKMDIEPETARTHVANIAAKLPNPDELKPYTLVLLTFAHRRWLTDYHHFPPESAA